MWVPDETHEATWDLARTRAAVVEDYRRKRQHVSAFLLRHRLIFEGNTTWKGRHLRWSHTQRNGSTDWMPCCRRSSLIGRWPVVAAFQAVRDVGFTSAATLVAGAGDIRRFDHPRQLMAFLGLVPSERSTGETRRQGGITKSGKSRARSPDRKQHGPIAIREASGVITKTAKHTFQSRFVVLRGRLRSAADGAGQAEDCRHITAVAREIAAFLWDLPRHVGPLFGSARPHHFLEANPTGLGRKTATSTLESGHQAATSSASTTKITSLVVTTSSS